MFNALRFLKGNHELILLRYIFIKLIGVLRHNNKALNDDNKLSYGGFCCNKAFEGVYAVDNFREPFHFGEDLNLAGNLLGS